MVVERPGKMPGEKLGDEGLICSTTIKKWTRGKLIGEGTFGKVYLATNKDTGEKFVVKSVNTKEVDQRLALSKEKRILSQSKSQYLVKYLGYAISKVTRATDRTATFDVFMEYVWGGDMIDQVYRNGGGLEEPIVDAYIRDVLKGLHYLHARGIVHGDLKCANLLVGDNNIKICDFGSAKIMEEGDLVLDPRPGENKRKRRIFVTGTHGYSAPEVLSMSQQDEMSDIYSLGCCLVEMLTGKPPEEEPSMFGLEFNEGDPEFNDLISIDVPPNCSQACHDFVGWCLSFHPEDRPSTKELLQCSWIVNAPPYPKVNAPLPVRSKSVIKKVSNFMGCGSSKNDILPQTSKRRH